GDKAPIAMLPAIAVRAVENAAPVEVRDARDLGKGINDAGRQQQHPAPKRTRLFGIHNKAVFLALDVNDCVLQEADRLVRSEILFRVPKKIAGLNAIAGEVAVQRV